MVYGPFDFIDNHLVPAEAWDTLLAKSKDMKVYINKVNCIIPLDQPDRQDRDVTEDTISRWGASQETEAGLKRVMGWTLQWNG
jgi:hypothetical protein